MEWTAFGVRDFQISRCITEYQTMKLKIASLLLIATLSVSLFGCSKADKDSQDMGPMPTAPPAGFAGPKPTMSDDAFVAKLQSLPRAERVDYMSQNPGSMKSIMSQSEGSPARQKLQAIIDQH